MKVFIALFVAGILLMGGTALAAGIVEISRQTRPGKDTELAQKVQAFLVRHINQQHKDCPNCKVVILVQNGYVNLSGIVGPNCLPHLKNIKSIQGVRSVNLTNVRSLDSHGAQAGMGPIQEPPMPRPEEGKLTSPGSKAGIAREMVPLPREDTPQPGVSRPDIKTLPRAPRPGPGPDPGPYK